jgi:hypothetical protein
MISKFEQRPKKQSQKLIPWGHQIIYFSLLNKRFPNIKAYMGKGDKFVKSAHYCFLKYKFDMADM